MHTGVNPEIIASAGEQAGARAKPIIRTVARLESIDMVRGVVMVLMVLDHVRDNFMGAHIEPLDPATTTIPLYLTRWITHLCAPTFIFLAGVSIHMMSRRMTPRALSRFLLTRGLWLIFLEATVVTLAWTFDWHYHIGVTLQVIWAIGLSMVILSAVARLPRFALGCFALILIFGHNLTDGIKPDAFGQWALLWQFLHVAGPFPFGFIFYPVIPWVGVMALGVVAGRIYQQPSETRTRVFAIAGACSIVAFVVLRGLNGYGDPSPWSAQPTLTQTLFSFFRVEKYPPSLDYLLATLGIAALMLASAEKLQGSWTKPFVVLGRVPLFFYVLHLYLAHLIAGLIALSMGRGTVILTTVFARFPADWNLGLAATYVGWLSVIAITYLPCKWFAGVRQRRKDWWLSYL